MYHLEFLIDGDWQRVVSPTGGRYTYPDLQDAIESVEIVRALGMPPGAEGIRIVAPDGSTAQEILELNPP